MQSLEAAGLYACPTLLAHSIKSLLEAQKGLVDSEHFIWLKSCCGADIFPRLSSGEYGL
jgi:hypothetical protein